MYQQHNNVDQAEIAKFEELASRWWDPNSEFKPLHDINPLRLNYINERAGLAGKRVVVKRPRKAPVISGPAPSYSLEGKSSRYDIYAKKKLS